MTRTCCRRTTNPSRANHWLIAAAVLLIACCLPSTVRADQASGVPVEQRNAAEAATQNLAALAARYRRATGPEQAQLLLELESVARERHAMLVAMVTSHPGEVKRLALPPGLAKGLPAEVQAYVESFVELEGELELHYVDYENPELSHIEYRLQTGQGQRLSLHFAEAAPTVMSGTKVRSRGLVFADPDRGPSDGAMVIGSGDNDMDTVAMCCTGSGSEGATAPILSNTFGEQRSVVLLANFADDSANQPWTIQEAHDLVFGTVSDYFMENSFQQTWLSGDVFGWLTLEFDSSSCDFTALTDAAAAAAGNQGIDLTSYDRQIIITPKNVCAFSGIASLGGMPSKTWINGAFELQTISHELGHNLGLRHAHSLDCGDVTLSSDCNHLEYGDTADTMGSPDGVHFNAFHKQRLGWLTDDPAGPIAAVTESGTYTLDAYAPSASAQPKSLRILREVDPATGVRTYFHLTYRGATGFDSPFDARSYILCRGDVTNAVTVHLSTDGDSNSSYLLHMRPQSCFRDRYGYLDWFDPGLVVGDSFTDAVSGVTISTVAVDPAGATVSIDFGQGACVSADPSIAISPVESPWLAPGSSFSYDVTVTNHDNIVCADGNFTLSDVVPEGWIGEFDSSVLTLSPGASNATTLVVTSSASAANGFYDITATAERSGDPNSTASGTASYVVEAALENQPPLAADDSASTAANTPIEIDVLANDMDPDGDPLLVTSVGNGSKGTVNFSAEGLVVYTPAPKAKGNDNFSYSVSDGQDVVSAVVSVSIAKGGGGGGGSNGGGGNGKGKGKR